MRVKTYPVTAGAYKSIDKGVYLTHLCEVDAEGYPIKVLCSRVKFDNILPDTAVATDNEPTCKTCANKFRRLTHD